MTIRKEVYEALDEEREYQDDKWGAAPKSQAEFLTYIQAYVSIAVFHETKGQHDTAAHAIRKITALGVACMEQNDAAWRHDENSH